MESSTHTLHGRDNSPIFYRSWLPEQTDQYKAVIHIAHGMAEHSKRYELFAEQCVKKNIAVYAHDHRGHGHTGAKDLLGHFDDHKGWDLVVSDMNDIHQMIAKTHASTPIITLGHSMGSFITQAFIFKYQPNISGLILSGSNYSAPIKYQAARLVAKIERLRKGPHYRSKLIDKLTFGNFNQRFKPNQTHFDWLSSDLNEVRKYVEDPHCGFICTTQLWCDLLAGLSDISKPETINKFNPDLPLLIFGGQEDPVGNYGNGLIALSRQYGKSGCKDIDLQIYPQGRHEMLNESNKVEVGLHIISWIESKLSNLN